MQSTTIGKKLYLGFLAVIVATGVVPALLSTIPALRRIIPQEFHNSPSPLLLLRGEEISAFLKNSGP